MALIEGGKKLGGFQYWCLGCKSEHYVRCFGPETKGPRWKFNGDWESPSFTPSVLYLHEHPADKEGGPSTKVTDCHHYVTNGQIRYLNDSRHALAGKTVRMVNLEVARKGEYAVEILASEAAPAPAGPARGPAPPAPIDRSTAPHASSRPNPALAPARPPPRPLAPPRRPAGPPPVPALPAAPVRLWSPRAKAPEVVSRFGPRRP